MKIKPSRIVSLLGTQGFVSHETNGTVGAFGLVRPDQSPGLYQRVIVSFAGRRAEAVFAYAALSALKWFQYQMLSETRLIVEIASNKERGWTEITSLAQAKEWENSLVQIAPAKVEEFAAGMRDTLLARTGQLRQQARARLERLDQRHPMQDQIRNLERSVPADVYADAVRLAEGIGVMQLYRTEEVYLLACLTILTTPDGTQFLGQVPIRNDDLMRQIQLVADGILSWDQNRELLKV